MIEPEKIEISNKKISDLLKAYYNLTNILEEILDRNLLYQEEFLKGIDLSLEELTQGKVTNVNNFVDFIS